MLFAAALLAPLAQQVITGLFLLILIQIYLALFLINRSV
jgi:hypothetical protein